MVDQPPVLSPQPGDLALGQRGFLGKRRKHDPQPVEAVDNGTFELDRVLIAHGHLRLTWRSGCLGSLTREASRSGGVLAPVIALVIHWRAENAPSCTVW